MEQPGTAMDEASQRQGRGLGRAAPVTRLLLIVAIAALSLAAFVAVGIFLFGEFGESEVRILLTTIAIAGFSLTAMAATTALRIGPRGIAEAGVTASAIGFVLTLFLIWRDTPSSLLGRSVAALIVLAAEFAFVALFLPRRPEHRGVAAVRSLTTALSVLVSAMILAIVIFEWQPDELYVRLLGSAAVLTVLGMLVVPILRRVAEPPPTSAPVARERGAELTLTYRGTTYAITVPASLGDQPAGIVTVRSANDRDAGPMTLDLELSGAEDRAAVLGKAVERLVRDLDRRAQNGADESGPT